MQQRGRDKFDARHLPLHAGNFNIFAEPKGFRENNGQPGHDIAEHALHRQTNAYTSHAGDGNQFHDIHSSRAQRDDQCHAEDKQPRNAHQKHPYRRFHRLARQPAVHQFADPTRDNETNHHHDQRRNERAAVADDVFDEFVLPGCCVSGFIHGSPQVVAPLPSFVKGIQCVSSILELLKSTAFLLLCRNRMTKKSRNWLILLLLIPTAVILAIVGLLIFQELQPLPPIQSLPNPNGYDDFVKAGEMANDNTGNYYEMKLEELRRLVAKNSDALQTARTGLQKDCAVPLQFSRNYMSRHIPELADNKRLAQAFAAEGRLAEMENRPSDAAGSYLDLIRQGNDSARGGVLIDALVGLAIENIGVAGLQKNTDRLDAKSCRETVAALETLDAQRQSWNEVIQQEDGWSRRTFTSLSYRIYRPLLSKMTREAFQKAERKFKEQQLKTRQLLIGLAARAYELDKGHRPASLADLVPDYLKAIPQDPVTGTNLVYSPR